MKDSVAVRAPKSNRPRGICRLIGAEKSGCWTPRTRGTSYCKFCFDQSQFVLTQTCLDVFILKYANRMCAAEKKIHRRPFTLSVSRDKLKEIGNQSVRIHITILGENI